MQSIDLAATAEELEEQRHHTGRVLVWDIETWPATAQVWGLKQHGYISPSMIVDHGGLMGVAAKWADSPEIMWRAEWHEGGRRAVVEWLWELLNQADVSVTYNGVGFDMKHVNREFILHGLPRPVPARQVDLLRVARKRFRFLSNKLDYVASQLGLGHKTQHAGIELWQKCAQGDVEAQALMGRYAKQDVRLTYNLYKRLYAWLDGSANMGLWTGAEVACSSCGGTDLVREAGKWVATAQTQYAVYRCADCQQLTRTNYVRARSLSRTPA